MSSLYKWTPLNGDRQFRLLNLFPGNPGDVLNCELNTASLDLSLRYEAISYSWESRDLPYTILCDGKRISITTNLHAALQHFRMPDISCSLWVDAICIDQTNNEEKSKQVQLMGEIFSGAGLVLIWLGTAPPASDSAMTFIQEFSPRKFAQIYDEIPDQTFVEVSDALRSLCLRQYWERLWIVQEVAKSKQAILFCGRYEISWETIMDMLMISMGTAMWMEKLSAALAVQGKETDMTFLDGFFRSHGPKSIIPPVVKEKASDSERQDKKKEILTLAVMTARKKCIDPRDKVFGIYNLLPPDIKAGVRVDYSLSEAAVFLTAAKAFIEGGACLDIISWPTEASQTPSSAQTQPQLPSWVPNWSSPLTTIPYAFYHDYWGDKPDPRNFLVSYRIQPDNALVIEGGMVGTISSILPSPILLTQLDNPATTTELHELWLYFMRCYINAGIEAKNARSFTDCVGLQYTIDMEFFDEWIARYQKVEDLPGPEEIILPLNALTWLGRCRLVQTYRTFFTYEFAKDKQRLLDGSRCGWGMTSTAVREGDVVCVLPGCLLPVILRVRDSGGYVIISDAYTHKTLVDDVLEGLWKKWLAVDEFCIR